MPLQRRITDFGADLAFARIEERLKEHYGTSVPVSAVRRITLGRAGEMRGGEQLQTEIPESQGKACVIAEMDGTMVPIVTQSAQESGEAPVDRRKEKQVGYQGEALLGIAYAQGSVSPVFGATMGSTREAGDQLAHCAIRAGAGQQTKVHCLGDGAPWIAEQVSRVFGLQGEYLIDFYQLSEYLAAAAEHCAPPTMRKTWLVEQQERAREKSHTDTHTASGR